MDPNDLGYQAAIARRQQAGQMSYGPSSDPIPLMIQYALNRRLRMPEQYPYPRHPLDYVPDVRPYVPHVLDVLGTLLHGLQYGRG